MKLECVEPFGNKVPGDVVEVADGAVFDTSFFREAPSGADPASIPVLLPELTKEGE